MPLTSRGRAINPKTIIREEIIPKSERWIRDNVPVELRVARNLRPPLYWELPLKAWWAGITTNLGY